MCTSITLKTNDGNNLLARTFDFDENLTNTIFVIPRNHPIALDSKSEKILSKLAFIGMGMNINNNTLFYDGINEKGLIAAALYLESSHVNEREDDKINISSATFLSWVLSQFEYVEEVIQNLQYINIIYDSIIEGEDYNPIHWIITDRNFNTIIIEQESKLITYKSDLGVLANFPNYKCQLKNLSCYSCVTPYDENLGLPGDTTSSTRFVKAAYFKKYSIESENEICGITQASKILDNVAIHKGMDIDNEYTHTISVLCSKSLMYYCYTYNNRQFQAFSLMHEDLNSNSIKEYELYDTQAINYRN